MQDFRKIQVWHRSHALALSVYKATKAFPPEELFGLTSQMRKAAVSLPANIVEGSGRRGGREFRRFLDVAFGSASELEYYLLLAYDLSLLGRREYETMSVELVEIKRMLAAFARAVRRETDRTN